MAGAKASPKRDRARTEPQPPTSTLGFGRRPERGEEDPRPALCCDTPQGAGSPLSSPADRPPDREESGGQAMRRNALRVGMIALALAGRVQVDDEVDPTRYASIEVDPKGAPPRSRRRGRGTSRGSSRPTGGGWPRRSSATSARASATATSPSTRTGAGWFFQKDANGRGPRPPAPRPGARRPLPHVEIRPEGTECVAIVRGTPKVDEAVALVLLDKVEEELKAGTGRADRSPR